MSQYISKTDAAMLHDLDRVIAHYRANGLEVPRLTVTKKQFDHLQKIAERLKGGTLYFPEGGEVRVSMTDYAGIQYAIRPAPRRRYRASDTEDFVNDGL